MPSAPSQQDAPQAALSNPEASVKRSLLAAPGGWVEVDKWAWNTPAIPMCLLWGMPLPCRLPKRQPQSASRRRC